eukprot:gene24398-24475_t
MPLIRRTALLAGIAALATATTAFAQNAAEWPTK